MPKSRKRVPSRGRAGGRAGASGYDFQDIYIALQLAKLLMGDRDAILEVLWEKRAIDFGVGRGAELVHVDDAIIRRSDGRCIYVQVKENAPTGGWSAANFVRSGVAGQFWNQWQEKTETDRPRTGLKLASAGDVSSLAMVVDDALRSNTPAELLSFEASKETADDVRTLAAGLSISPDDPTLLSFFKSLQFEQLPAALELQAQLERFLAPFGGSQADVAAKLIRLVSMSKHVGPSARASHRRDSLIEALKTEGVPLEAFVAVGLVRRSKAQDDSFWDGYRGEVVKKFRTFRVYGLNVKRAVFADLPRLFVPLRFAEIQDRKRFAERFSGKDQARRPSFELFLDDAESERRETEEGQDIGSVLKQKRRFALVGGPGSGKTTCLKWLALLSALSGEEGERMRSQFGLPEEALVPVFVRFRSLAERIRARGMEGVTGRVGLVSEFLAVEFEAGWAGRLPGRMESLEIAEELLNSPSSIFLFDALDEVADPSMRSRLFEAVGDLMSRYPEPRVVLSSRPYAFRDESAFSDLALFEPLALSRMAQRTFARQWYRAVRSHIGEAPAEEDAEAQATDLARAALRVPDLAENPLLLSILALVHFNRQGLAIERGVLYDHATLAMLGHWERDPAGRNLGEDAVPPDWARRLRLEEAAIRRVVESLAHDVQVHASGSEFQEVFAIDALARGLIATDTVQSADATKEAELLLALLVERSGLIQERSPGVFAFVHLSFQDYLTARWFIGAGETSLRELSPFSEEERYAEVIRFAVAILTSEHRPGADDQAVRLILEVGSKNPTLAAACLLEGPSLRLSEQAAEGLARRVWESSQSWRYHLHPRVSSRLMWILLAQTPRADELLLEFLMLEPDEHDRPRGGPEDAVSLLTSRPAVPMSTNLQRVLVQLANGADKQSWIPFWAIASLVLVESHCARTEHHLPGLVRLLDEGHWARDERGSLGDRAEKILRDLHASGAARREIALALEAALKGSTSEDDYQSDRVACASAKLLISLGIESSRDAIEVLVERGLREKYRHDEISDDLSNLLKDERYRELTINALVRGLTSDSGDLRSGCARILRSSDRKPPALALLLDQEGDEERYANHLRELLSDSARVESTLAGLADALWDEDPNVSWRAARALLEHGQRTTPGVPQAIVRAGLGSDARRSAAYETLNDLRKDPHVDLAVKSALFDALRSDQAKVAAASALFLIEIGEARGDDRLARITKASLRDTGVIGEVLIRLRELLGSDARAVVVRVVGEYLGAEELDVVIASQLAVLLAQTGHWDTPNLSRGLILGGLANRLTRDEAQLHLKKLLEDPRFVTKTRKALSEGLQAKRPDVAWGCVECLWESGSRTDPRVAAALTRSGLTDPKNREKAAAWLSELLRRPRTASKALSAAEEVASEALSSYRGLNYDKAWEIGRCLLAAGFVNSEHFVKALVVGGLGRRERHEEVLSTVRSLLEAHGAMAQRIEGELWSAVSAASEKKHDQDVQSVAWGAARALIEIRAAGVSELFADPSEDSTKCATEFMRTLLRESREQPLALETIQRLVESPDSKATVLKILKSVLRDEDDRVSRAGAQTLLLCGDAADPDLPLALLQRGQGWYEERSAVGQVLDDLRRRPLIGIAVMEALQQALWSSDQGRAWSAAVYLMDSGAWATAGLGRALLFAGMTRGGFHEDADVRVRSLLENPASRAATLDALRAALVRAEVGRAANIASLLVLTGEPLHERILAEFDSEKARRRWPLAPLCALALSGRVDEARAAVRGSGFVRLRELIGEGDVCSTIAKTH